MDTTTDPPVIWGKNRHKQAKKGFHHQSVEAQLGPTWLSLNFSCQGFASPHPNQTISSPQIKFAKIIVIAIALVSILVAESGLKDFSYWSYTKQQFSI